MQRVFSKRIPRWLLPTVLILFILEVISLPIMLGITYSGRSEAPDLVLNYTEGKLTWDSATAINQSGVAELSLFDAVYDDAKSTDGKNIVAPGTEGINIVRLKNQVSGSINYTAVLYRIRTNDQLPVEVSLKSESSSDTTDYPLPNGVTEKDVIRAVNGTMRGDEIRDFDISWLWEFDEGTDDIDTMLGNESELDQVMVGMYVVVEDNNNYILPSPPQTGDNSSIGIYIALMVISLVLLLLLLIERRRDKKCAQQ